MILIPEQVKQLREENRRIKESLSDYKDYFDDRKVVASEETFASVVGDGFTEGQYQSELSRLKENERLLEESTYLKERITDEIAIGTKMNVLFDGEDEEETLTLIDEYIGATVLDGYISLQSVMGQNILGKKALDEFSYTIKQGNNSSNTISGIIKSIEEKQYNHDHFITERPYANRICIEEKMRNKELKETNQEEILKEQQAITESQKDLLVTEARRLLKKGANSYSEKARLARVQELLRDRVMVELPEDDKIGIGSSFSIMLFSGEKTEIKRVEMINRAVSDETESEYIERISPLGHDLIGLSNQEEFTCRLGKDKLCSGIVFDIDNGKESFKSSDATIYQKNKNR